MVNCLPEWLHQFGCPPTVSFSPCYCMYTSLFGVVSVLNFGSYKRCVMWIDIYWFICLFVCDFESYGFFFQFKSLALSLRSRLKLTLYFMGSTWKKMPWNFNLLKCNSVRGKAGKSDHKRPISQCTTEEHKALSSSVCLVGRDLMYEAFWHFGSSG